MQYKASIEEQRILSATYLSETTVLFTEIVLNKVLIHLEGTRILLELVLLIRDVWILCHLMVVVSVMFDVNKTFVGTPCTIGTTCRHCNIFDHPESWQLEDRVNSAARVNDLFHPVSSNNAYSTE